MLQTSPMQLLRLGRSLDSDWEKFDIELMGICEFSTTFARRKLESPNWQGGRTRAMQRSTFGPESFVGHAKACHWVPVGDV